MINALLNIIAPHYCYACGEVGSVLCGNCAYDIISESYAKCLECEKPATHSLCSGCKGSVSYVDAYCVGERTGSIKEILDGYKFERQLDAAQPLARLLDEAVPHLPPDCIITTIPTDPAHIRVRGYDHAAELGRRFAMLRELSYVPLLSRKRYDAQRGASKAARARQVEGVFEARRLTVSHPILLVDDIYTTGATIREAAKVLAANSSDVALVATVARQPSTK